MPREHCPTRKEITIYEVTRRELLAAISIQCKFLSRADHSTIQLLRRTPEPVGQQVRWHAFNKQHHFEIPHRPGSPTPEFWRMFLEASCPGFGREWRTRWQTVCSYFVNFPEDWMTEANSGHGIYGQPATKRFSCWTSLEATTPEDQPASHRQLKSDNTVLITL